MPEEFCRCSSLKCLGLSDIVLLGEKLDNRADSRNAFDGLPEGDRLFALFFTSNALLFLLENGDF